MLQGLEDEVVPPAQAEMHASRRSRRKGLPYAYLLFEGEQHGFRAGRDTSAAALEAELSFYGQILGFVPAGDIEPVQIENRPPGDPVGDDDRS